MNVKKPIFNILLLGQTGSGKSTFVNSIANYFTYSNFDEAIAQNKPICLIPMKFSIARISEGKEPIVINLKGYNVNDQNEQHENIALSSTSDPMIYEFCGENVEYHIIDVPGIGDTGGVNIDAKNKNAIMKTLENFSILHGIFIVLNSTQPKLTTEIKNCYNEILMELHRSSTPIIMFVMTFSRTSDFMPGISMDPLRTYVTELAQRDHPIKIELNNKTVFCVDNDGIRYQCGIKNPEFKEKFVTFQPNFKLNWEKSREAVFQMFKIMESNQGHLVSQSVNISKSRYMIKYLMGALAKVCTILEKEMSAEMKDAQIRSLMETGNLIKKETTVEKLEHPQCVCLSCAGKGQTAGTSQIQLDFKIICHNKCILPGAVPDKFPEPKLKDCAAFDQSGHCIKCKCHHSKHLRISRKTFEKYVAQPNRGKLTKEQAEKFYNEFLLALQSEQSIIWSTIIKLAKFLKCNAIVDFNPLFKEKLETEIRIQNDMRKNDEVTNNLQKRLKRFQLEMETINSALQRAQMIEAAAEEIDVNSLANQLFGLKIFGNLIKKLYDVEASLPSSDQTDATVRFTATHTPSA